MNGGILKQKMENVNVKTLTIIMKENAKLAHRFWTAWNAQELTTARHVKIKETSIQNQKTDFVFVKTPSGLTQHNALNAVQQLMIANHAHKMVKNAHNANLQTANQMHNKQNAFVSTLNIKINRQKSANFVIFIKIALLVNLNNLINVSNAILKNTSNKSRMMMVSVYAQHRILLKKENVTSVQKLWLIANSVIQSKDVFCAKMKIISIQLR